MPPLQVLGTGGMGLCKGGSALSFCTEDLGEVLSERAKRGCYAI